MSIARDTRTLGSILRGRACSLVPTMGALHAGHLRLIETARRTSQDRPVVVSVFVNPAQFNDASDFERYPREVELDAQKALHAGADAVFAPGVDHVYPDGVRAVDGRLPDVALGRGLEDEGRPGHFQGVVRVLRRLFELTGCRSAVFGEKDWQQLLVARTIDPNVEIVPHPVERDPDGLAMSSRNRHLSPAARARALSIPRAIETARGAETVGRAHALMAASLGASGVGIEYATVRDAATLERLPESVRPGDLKSPARVLVTGIVDDVRLLDNAPWP